MLYAETSFAGKPIFGHANPTPTHFQHIADRQDFLRRKAIMARCRAARGR